MKINYKLDENNRITEYQEMPFDENQNWIEIENPNLITLGVSKIINGELILNEKDAKKEKQLIYLRDKREEECFSIINRGQLWYDNLSSSQVKELNEWYKAWLNVTETLKEPIKPSWL